MENDKHTPDQRLAAYLARLNRSKGIDREIIHAFNGHEFECRASDIVDVLKQRDDLLAFAQAYLDMANDVTARGSQARPTFLHLNALLEQARAAIAKARA